MLKCGRGFVVIPDLLVDYHSDTFLALARAFAGVLGLKLVVKSRFDPALVLPKSLVVAFAVPCRGLAESIGGQLPRGARLVYWVDDFAWNDDRHRESVKQTLDRADLVLYANKSWFLNFWGQYEPKSRFFPLFASPSFLGRGLNPTPLNKCLLSGNRFPHHYPIRHAVAQNGKAELGDLLEMLPHPRDGGTKVHASYADALWSHMCCVTDSGNGYDGVAYKANGSRRFTDEYMRGVCRGDRETGGVLKKYFEIPATGSLLIADDRTPEFRELGFEPYRHFVPIESDTAFDVIRDCLADPGRMAPIREEGMRLVRERHTLDNRIALLSEIGATL